MRIIFPRENRTNEKKGMVVTMDDQLTEKIRTLLADPQAMERIAAIAGSLGFSSGSEGQPSQPRSDPAPAPPAQPAFAPQQGLPSGGFQTKDPRLDLLRALRPLVSEEKRGRLDDLVRIATVASLLGNIRR